VFLISVKIVGNKIGNVDNVNNVSKLFIDTFILLYLQQLQNLKKITRGISSQCNFMQLYLFLD
jgi:hypothetical protein